MHFRTIAFASAIGLTVAAPAPNPVVRRDPVMSILPVTEPEVSILPVEPVARDASPQGSPFGPCGLTPDPGCIANLIDSSAATKRDDVDVDKIIDEAQAKAVEASKKAEAAAKAFQDAVQHNNGTWTANHIISEAKKKAKAAEEEAKKIADAAKKAAQDAIEDAKGSDKRSPQDLVFTPEQCEALPDDIPCLTSRDEASDLSDKIAKEAKEKALEAVKAANEAVKEAQEKASKRHI